jgi:hypothetical protein
MSFFEPGHLFRAPDAAFGIDPSLRAARWRTLVTHNTTDYQKIPAMRLDDWLIP